jgi:hypothetical protein
VEDLLRPMNDRTSVTGQTPHSSPRAVPQPLHSADSVPYREAMTIPEAPMPKGAPFDAARLTARVSETPPNAGSYATLGSAALDASQPELPQAKSRKGVVAVIALLAVAAVAATGVSFTVFRAKPAPATAAAAPPAAATATATAPTATATASTAPTQVPAATTTGSTPAGIPTYAASSLPKVTPKVPVWTPPVRWTPPPTTAAPATAAPKPKPKVDDGF